MILLRFLVIWLSACQEREEQAVSPIVSENEEKVRLSPYRHFEVTGTVKGIELNSLSTVNSSPPYQYGVTLLIQSTEISPPLKQIPDSLKVKDSPGVLRIAIDERPTLKKSFLATEKSFVPIGPKVDPYSSLSTKNWGKYTVGETVSIGVIYTGADK